MSAERFSRQIPLLGEEGQDVLCSSKVGVVGVGGLGCNALTHLATAGVGSFVLVDHQFPEESNLNRQFVHCLAEPDASKARSGADWLSRLNPAARAIAVTGPVDGREAVEQLQGCNILLDCLDNHESRLWLNRFALKNRIPLIHAAVQEWHGQVMVVDAGTGPCLKCILPHGESKPHPIIGSVAGVVGSIQANEAIKALTGEGGLTSGHILTVDLSRNRFQILEVARDPGCSHCSQIMK